MNQPDCLFCKIIRQEIPAKLIYEDALCIAFEDINPQAPMHVLIIPRTHIETANDLMPEHEPLVGHMIGVAAKLAQDRGVAQTGFRSVLNCNRAAGQSVFHLHLHVLGGRSFGWPPG